MTGPLLDCTGAGRWHACNTHENPSEAHVHPLRDLVDHTRSDDCVCGPTSKLIRGVLDGDGDGWVVTHAALDGRELDEQALR